MFSTFFPARRRIIDRNAVKWRIFSLSIRSPGVKVHTVLQRQVIRLIRSRFGTSNIKLTSALQESCVLLFGGPSPSGPTWARKRNERRNLKMNHTLSILEPLKYLLSLVFDPKKCMKNEKWIRTSPSKSVQCAQCALCCPGLVSKDKLYLHDFSTRATWKLSKSHEITKKSRTCRTCSPFHSMPSRIITVSSKKLPGKVSLLLVWCSYQRPKSLYFFAVLSFSSTQNWQKKKRLHSLPFPLDVSVWVGFQQLNVRSNAPSGV